VVAIRNSHDLAELRDSNDPRPRAQQRLLKRLVGVLSRAQHSVAVGMQLSPPRRHQIAECRLVTRERRLESRLLARHLQRAPGLDYRRRNSAARRQLRVTVNTVPLPPRAQNGSRQENKRRVPAVP